MGPDGVTPGAGGQQGQPVPGRPRGSVLLEEAGMGLGEAGGCWQSPEHPHAGPFGDVGTMGSPLEHPHPACTASHRRLSACCTYQCVDLVHLLSWVHALGAR